MTDRVTVPLEVKVKLPLTLLRRLAACAEKLGTSSETFIIIATSAVEPYRAESLDESEFRAAGEYVAQALERAVESIEGRDFSAEGPMMVSLS